eukprot:Sro579_g169940.1 Glycosidase (211) ;mRNA; f:7229-7861
MVRLSSAALSIHAIVLVLFLLHLHVGVAAFPLSKDSSSYVLQTDEDLNLNQNNQNCTDHPPRQHLYDVVVTELDAVGNHNASLISRINGSSDFEFNFNPAWFPVQQQQHDSHDTVDGLIVRLVDSQKHPEWVNAGALAVVPVNLNNKPMAVRNKVTESMVTWAGAEQQPTPTQPWGAADPRITYRPKTQQYYLTWDNCTKNCWPHRVTYLS